ncbi:MAG: hypothetical protein O2851_06645, partial [Proteobacteria bacterium]|nr:hypothetical protein [Pseudomonadota bacterium]
KGSNIGNMLGSDRHKTALFRRRSGSLSQRCPCPKSLGLLEYGDLRILCNKQVVMSRLEADIASGGAL